MSRNRIGIDIGGSGIKGAVIDLDDGTLVGERIKVDTPQPATPEKMGGVVAAVTGDLAQDGPVGIGFPSVIVDDVARTANNIDRSWIGVNVRETFEAAVGRPVSIINDADAAALSEASYGVARGVEGLVVVLTFGSGIGSGLLEGGKLIRNVELGGIELEGHRPAEVYFSAKARRREGLSWDEWGERANRYVTHIHGIFTPELIAIGGGVSRQWIKWSSQIDSSLPVVQATAANNGGIVGAATLVG